MSAGESEERRAAAAGASDTLQSRRAAADSGDSLAPFHSASVSVHSCKRL